MDNNYIYNYYFDKIIVKNEIPSFVDKLKYIKERTKLLNDNNNKYFGFAFLLDNMNVEKNIKLMKEEIKVMNDKIILKQNKLNSIFPWPPKIGLDKIGESCFMNATLQCFCQIEEFVLLFKYDKQIDEVIDKYIQKNDNCLTKSFKNLIEKIWPDEAKQYEMNERHFPPDEFRKTIADMCPLFANNQANDAKDLVNFIIMNLHEELYESKESKEDNNIMNQMNICLNNNNNQSDILKSFYEEYKITFSSKISELFYAIQQIQTRCLNCINIHYNFQGYFFVVFPLEEVRKYTINKISEVSFNNMNLNLIMNNGLNQKNNDFNFIPPIPLNNNLNPNSIKLNKLNNDIVNIMDCFEYNQKIEFFTGTNQIYCNKCKKMANANNNTILTTAPKVLILLLNRGVGMQLKIKLEFTNELDITNYVTQKNGNIKYRLIGVITYLGESGTGGHFIAHCLSPIDNEWYKYDDATVSKIDDFQKQIIELGMPYLLFYKKFE